MKTAANEYYTMALLEEIRHLLAENLLINACIYDKLRMDGLPTEEPTYEVATKVTNKSFEVIDKLHKELQDD